MKTIGRVAVAVLVCCLASVMGPSIGSDANATASKYPNSEMPTLGGAQFWQDTYVHAQWRIQRNVLTGHSRLLDPKNVRRAWGTSASCARQFDALRKAHNIRPQSSHLVVLLHGIARSTGTFTAMERALTKRGYDAVIVSYPSTRGSIEQHASALTRVLDRLEGTETVSFVTHSMGGLVLRQMLAMEGDWQSKLTAGRIVMIAPPNQGSSVAETLKDNPLYNALYGVAGQQLVPAYVTDMPSMKSRSFGIIAGGRDDGQGFNPFLEGDDDGTVKVSETRIAGAKEQIVVPALHSLVSDHPKTIRATLNFLTHGHFNLSDHPN